MTYGPVPSIPAVHNNSGSILDSPAYRATKPVIEMTQMTESSKINV